MISQRYNKLSARPLLSILFAVLTLFSFSLLASSETNPQFHTFKLPLPKKYDNDYAGNASAKTHSNWQQHSVTIQRNDSLSTALYRLKIPANISHQITQTENSHLLTDLRVGDELKVWLDQDSNLQRILYPKSQITSYELINTGEGFSIKKNVADVETRTESASGTIDGAFYTAVERAGLSARSIMKLADIFGWDIDFGRQLRPGDTFRVIYQTRYLNGKYIGDGDIIAAQLTSNAQNDVYNAFLVKDGDKTIGYFDEKGNSMKKAFLRSPVDYVRITSRFNPKRFHPVLKEWRSHRGVDYGGPKGTPIRATGNGKIITRGWGTGYGRYIKISHPGNYITVYGHLSKFGKFKKGSYVKQGDVIGYMGKSGLATGVHLHYEFRENNRHVDPLKVKFPNAGPLAKKYRTEFKQRANFLLAQLERLENNTHIARKFE